jgi:acyl-CoA thioester hydrolase
VIAAAPGYQVAVSIPVRFRDLDGLGHVNNAVFSTYLELARETYWSVLLGVEPSDLTLASWTFILARTECDFRSQIPYGGAVRVSIRVPELPRPGGKSWLFEYRLDDGRDADEDSPAYADARTVQVMFDYDAQTTVPVSDDVRRRFVEIDGLADQNDQDDEGDDR